MSETPIRPTTLESETGDARMVESPETNVEPNAANGDFLTTNFGEAGDVKYQAKYVRGRGTALTR